MDAGVSGRDVAKVWLEVGAGVRNRYRVHLEVLLQMTSGFRSHAVFRG